MIVRELAGPFVDEVAAFGHRKRNQRDLGVGKAFDGPFGVLRRQDEVHDGADDAGCLQRSAALHHRIQIILLLERIAHGCVVGQHTHAALAPVSKGAPLQQVIEVNGLVRAVKRADTDMDAAGAKLTAVVPGLPDAASELAERCA